MRRLLFIMLVAASGSANGQANLTGQAVAIPEAHQNPKNFDERSRPSRECLIEKATGKRVCHTRSTWKSIAQKIGKGNGQL